MKKERLFALMIALMMTFTFMPTMAFANVGTGEEESATIANSEDSSKSIATARTKEAVKKTEESEPELKSAETVGAASASGTCGDDATWTLSDDGTLTISGTGKIEGGEFYEYDNIKKLVIEDGITAIGGWEFEDCDNLESAIVGDSVKAIGDGAFYGCDSLQEIVLPAGLEIIEYDNFEDCESLTDIYFKGTAEGWISACNAHITSLLTKTVAIHVNYGTSKADKVEIVLDCLGGTVSGSRFEFIETEALTQELKLPDAIQARYKFNGWEDKDGEIVCSLPAGTNADSGIIILEADWEDDAENTTAEVRISNYDIPIAVNGQAYSTKLIDFADNDYEHEVICYPTRQDGYDDFDYINKVSSWNGLTFSSDGTVKGTPNVSEDSTLYFLISVVYRDNGKVVYYKLFEGLELNIITSPEKMNLPSVAEELDSSKFVNTYNDTLAAGQAKWYKVVATGVKLILDWDPQKWDEDDDDYDELEYESLSVSAASDNEDEMVTIKLYGADGLRRSTGWWGFYYEGDMYITSPGDTYYVYAKNNDTSEHTVVIDYSGYSEIASGILGDLVFEKKSTNVTRKFEGESNTKWDVYTVGDNEYEKWYNVRGYTPFSSDYLWVGLDVIAPFSVYYENPAISKNFGGVYSVNSNDELMDDEEDLVLSEGEQHNKVNYTFNIADRDYSVDRESKFSVDVYIPAGYYLYKGEDGYLHGTTEHTHDIIAVAAKASTCSEEGNKAHYKCSICGKLFSDAAGKNEISKEAVIIAKTAHTWDEVQTTAPTCTAEGVKTYTCTVCGETKTDPIAKIAHTIVSVPEKAATATENGYKAHYKCSVCGKLFSDAAGANEISSPEVIPATGSQTNTNTSAAQTVAEPAPTLAVTAKISKPKAAKGAVTVKWKKASKKVQKKISGYQIQVATDSSFTNVVKTVKGGKKASSKKIKLAKKTQYYVRIRAVKGSAFGAWSAVKAVKTK